MLRFKQYLEEARRNPKLNPKVRPIDVVNLHARDPRVFVTFTQIPKVGLNPGSNFETPLGIYSYPVSRVQEKAERAGTVHASMPFASDAPYVSLFRQKGTILDLNRPSLEHLSAIQDTVKEMVEEKGGNWDELVEKANRGSRVPGEGGWIWALTYFYNRLYGNARNNAHWNHVFRRAGIDAAVDRGAGIIHGSEPYQAVHFDRRTIDVIEMLENKKPSIETRQRNMGIKNYGYREAVVALETQFAEINGSDTYNDVLGFLEAVFITKYTNSALSIESDWISFDRGPMLGLVDFVNRHLKNKNIALNVMKTMMDKGQMDDSHRELLKSAILFAKRLNAKNANTKGVTSISARILKKRSTNDNKTFAAVMALKLAGMGPTYNFIENLKEYGFIEDAIKAQRAITPVFDGSTQISELEGAIKALGSMIDT